MRAGKYKGELGKRLQTETADEETAPAGTASKGRYATERAEARADLSAIEVSVQYQTPDGTTVTVRQTAAEALQEIGEQESRMDALQKCLEN